MALYCPGPLHGPSTSGEHCTGDGSKMGEAAGAKSDDPDEADFFYVPLYLICVVKQENKSAHATGAFYKEFISSQAAVFQKYRRRDHISYGLQKCSISPLGMITSPAPYS